MATMAARPSLEELLRDMAPEKLDQPCRDDHLSEIALSITEWQSVAPFLGLTEAEEREIEEDSRPSRRRKVAMLRRWREKYGKKATYRKLAKVFWMLELVDLAEELCEILSESSQSDNDASSEDGLISYASYLRGRYQTQIPTFLTLQWPPPPTRHVFNLAMIQGQNIRYDPIDEDMVRLLLEGRVNDILYQKIPVKLEEIFHIDKAKHKVILIEGAPGSGKSTLAWFICQQWESGKLFQDFQAVIFIQLRDPAIQSARSVEDILPARSRRQAERVVGELQACGGQGILWVMDGWDELPSYLHAESVFHELTASPEIHNLHFSTIIITSRPIASGDLYDVISSRVEILGFTPTELKDYFTEAVGGDSQTVQKLQDQLKERPVIEASCYLPLNAAIVTHLFLTQKHNLPTTLHGVFTSLVLCCLVRHAIKEGKGIGDILSLNNLPLYLQEPLEKICALAYHGVMANKVTFSTGELKPLGFSQELATLGLIQGVESFASFKKSVSFNFLHLSVQELLASFYISKLPQSEQVDVFKILFGRPRFAAVFQFYAAFTKLETEGIREIIASILKKKEKPQLLYLLNGLYEAQDLSLCQFVGSQLKGELDLSDNTLNPVDCLSISYYISCNNRTDTCHLKVLLIENCGITENEVNVLLDPLNWCWSLEVLNVAGNAILDTGVSCIAKSLEQNNALKSLNIRKTGITEKGVECLANCLESLRSLDLRDNHVMDAGIVSVVESLEQSYRFESLNVPGCGITEKGAESLADYLIKTESLEFLNLHTNLISDTGATLIANVLPHNCTLKELRLSKCGLTDGCMRPLACALEMNTSLQILYLGYNHFTDNGLALLGESLMKNRRLQILYLWFLEKVTAEGLKQFVLSLQENCGLKILGVTGILCEYGAVQHDVELVNQERRERGITELKIC